MQTAPGSGGTDPPNQPPGGNTNRPFDFLGLPAELRNRVYKYLLAPAETCICNFVHLDILSVNRQLHEEARPILHGYWAPRLRSSLEAAGMDVQDMRSSMLQQLTNTGTFAQPNGPVRILLSTDDITAEDPTVHPFSLLQIAQQSAMAEAMAGEMNRLIMAAHPGTQSVVLHLDITASPPDARTSFFLFEFVGALRVRGVTIEIHDPDYEEDGGANVNHWVQTLQTEVPQHQHRFLPGTVVTVRAYQ